MKKQTIVTGALLSGLAVVFGAFGAHILKSKLGPDAIHSFETGVRYQMYHGLALLIISALFNLNSKSEKWMVSLIMVGTLLFSGSIYLLSMDEFWGVKLNFFGPITPLGGLLLIAGWVMFVWNARHIPTKQ